jgi:LacI family transcriptional regulator
LSRTFSLDRIARRAIFVIVAKDYFPLCYDGRVSKKKSMSASLKSIAASTNLSVRTVAYILNTDRAKLFRPETRERVEAAAAALGYRPNSAAQAMRRGRFDAVGLIQATRADRGLLSVFTLAAIEDELLQRDHRLVLSMVPDERLTSEERMPKILREWSVDGLMVAYNAAAPTAFRERLDQARIPAVWINTKADANTVFPDDLGAAAQATRHLISLGHRRITHFRCFPGSSQSHYSVVDRQRGYEKAMTEAGLKPAYMIPEQLLLPSERIDFVTRTLTAPDRPTAIIAYGAQDHVLPCLVASMRLNLQLGKELSLCGFSDGAMTESGISISTMEIPTYVIGQEAVRMLMERIAATDKAPLPAKALPFEFHIGETIGRPG